jgi:ankyrin repeat protein
LPEIKNFIHHSQNFVNDTNTLKKQAFVHGARYGHLHVVEYVINLGYDSERLCIGALEKAAEFGHIDVVKYLILLGYAPIKSKLILGLCTISGQIDMIKYLIQNGLSCDPQKENRHITNAAMFRHKNLIEYFVSVGFDPKFQNDKALITSAKFGYVEIVECLIKLGCNPRNQNDQALRSAANHGHLPMVKYLVKLGCDLQSENNQALITSITNGHLAVTKFILKKINFDPNCKFGEYIFHKAINGCYVKTIEHLICLGCNYENGVALNISVYNGNFRIAKYLISLGCDVKKEFDKITFGTVRRNPQIYALLLSNLENRYKYRTLHQTKTDTHVYNNVAGNLNLQTKQHLKKNSFLKFALRPCSLHIQLIFI